MRLVTIPLYEIAVPLEYCVFHGFSQKLCSANGDTHAKCVRSFRTPAYSGPCHLHEDPPTGRSCLVRSGLVHSMVNYSNRIAICCINYLTAGKLAALIMRGWLYNRHLIDKIHYVNTSTGNVILYPTVH